MIVKVKGDIIYGPNKLGSVTALILDLICACWLLCGKTIKGGYC